MKFTKGQRINHESLGSGTIIEVEERYDEKANIKRDLDLIKVEFDSSEASRSFNKLVEAADGVHKKIQVINSKIYLFNSKSLEEHIIEGGM